MISRTSSSFISKILSFILKTGGFGSNDDNKNAEISTGYSFDWKLNTEPNPVEEIRDF